MSVVMRWPNARLCSPSILTAGVHQGVSAARHRSQRLLHDSTQPANNDVGLTLSWRVPVSSPSRLAPRAIVPTVAA